MNYSFRLLRVCNRAPENRQLTHIEPSPLPLPHRAGDPDDAEVARPICSNQGSKRPWGWPYSGPSAAGISGVNAGESRGLCRGSCRARPQVRGSVVLAPEGRSGTLTRKRSLVQIQYGPPGISCSWPYQVALNRFQHDSDDCRAPSSGPRRWPDSRPACVVTSNPLCVAETGTTTYATDPISAPSGRAAHSARSPPDGCSTARKPRWRSAHGQWPTPLSSLPRSHSPEP